MYIVYIYVCVYIYTYIYTIVGGVRLGSAKGRERARGALGENRATDEGRGERERVRGEKKRARRMYSNTIGRKGDI